MAAATLYSAWDSSYSDVQDARDFWFSLRISQAHFNIGQVSISPVSGSTTNITLTFQYLGQTLYGNIDIIHNGTYVSFLNLGWLVPNNNYTVTITNGADTSGSLNNVVLAFANGCQLIVTYHYDTTNEVYVVDGKSVQCPAEVS
ncbi:archaeal flagellar protein FlaF [Pyrococcus sp. ST04]|nr:archaeal flagellar protein FlaF [Pyrococcus sp. ST04]